MKSQFKEILKAVAVVCITIAIFYFIFTKIDFYSVVEVLLHANLFYLLIALLLLVIGVLITAKRWQTIINRKDIDLMFSCLFLPSCSNHNIYIPAKQIHKNLYRLRKNEIGNKRTY
jgi:uncharacterized membrane protein YbhN (UPF0104 family)